MGKTAKNNGATHGPAQNVVKAATADFHLDFGEKVQLEPEGLGFRLHCYFIGLVKYKYLILRLSPLGLDSSSVAEHLVAEKAARLFYAHEGVLHGFLCRIIAQASSPYRHVYLSYPHDAEFYTLRNHVRHQCHVPVSIGLGQETYRGMALNFSEGGLGVCLSVPEERQEDFVPGAEVVVGCSLVSAQGVSRAVCGVRNVRRLGGRLVLGLSLDRISDSSRGRILAFLQHLERFF
jgi:hypothetical protein